MPSTLLFHRSAGFETHSEYFGAVTSGPPQAHYYQAERQGDGTPEWQRWSAQALTQTEFDAPETTRPPYQPPYPVKQTVFLQLLKAFILPLL